MLLGVMYIERDDDAVAAECLCNVQLALRRRSQSCSCSAASKTTQVAEDYPGLIYDKLDVRSPVPNGLINEPPVKVQHKFYRDGLYKQKCASSLLIRTRNPWIDRKSVV